MPPDNPPPSSGGEQPGATTPNTIVLVIGDVTGQGQVGGSMNWTLTATGPAGTIVGGIPRAFIPTTVGVENFPCGVVDVALHTTCTGTTVGNSLEGAMITVRFATASGTADTTGTALIAGDVNADGELDIRDFLVLIRDFGHETGQILNPNADVNGDGQVDIRDFLVLIQNFGRSVPLPQPLSFGR